MKVELFPVTWYNLAIFIVMFSLIFHGSWWWALLTLFMEYNVID